MYVLTHSKMAWIKWHSGVLGPSHLGRNHFYCKAGAQPALHFGRGQFSWNFIWWRHRAYSTVVQLFRKRSHIIIMYFFPQTRSP